MPRTVLPDILAEFIACRGPERAALLASRLRQRPRCATTRYLAGCTCFDEGFPALAVRHMMIAHHAEPNLQSAALLVFTGLNAIARRGDSLLPIVVDTWEEYGRRPFDVTPRERFLFDALAAPDPGLGSDVLARRLWRMPLETLREQLQAALQTRDAGLYPRLTAAL
jgi:hypothetical protein